MAERDPNQPDRDPSDAAGGDQPLTDEQRSEIKQLGGEEAMPEGQLTQAEAEQLIDQLRHRTGGETG